MHVSAYQFFVDRAAVMPPVEYLVEVGGRDVNGSIIDLFTYERRTVLDLHPGPNVDVVADALTWQPSSSPQLVLCAEVLEHAPKAGEMLARIHDWLAPGGVLLLATVGDPWPPHSGYDGGVVRIGEFYRGVELDDLHEWMQPFGFRHVTAEPNGDRFAVGFKEGMGVERMHLLEKLCVVDLVGAPV